MHFDKDGGIEYNLLSKCNNSNFEFNLNTQRYRRSNSERGRAVLLTDTWVAGVLEAKNLGK